MNELDIGNNRNDFATIPDVPVAPESTRIAPQQMGSGISRGAQAIIGSTGVPQILSGVHDTFGPGFYVSKPSVNAITNTDAAQWAFNSNQNVLKIVSTGTAFVVAVAGSGQFDVVTHNLGYVPMVMATCKSPLFPGSNRAMLPYISFPDTTGKVVATIEVVQTDIIQFGVELGTTAAGSVGTWEFKYFLLQETAT
jgi:hypothetical protein